MSLDKHFRRLYKHAEEYRKAVNALADASKLMADDFAEALARCVPQRGARCSAATAGRKRSTIKSVAASSESLPCERETAVAVL